MACNHAAVRARLGMLTAFMLRRQAMGDDGVMEAMESDGDEAGDETDLIRGSAEYQKGAWCWESPVGRAERSLCGPASAARVGKATRCHAQTW